MNRAQTLARIESAWSDFADVITSVPDGMMDVPGAVGSWSVKDVIGHVATWDLEALRALRRFVEDRNTQALVAWPDVDEFNDQQWKSKRGIELTELRRELEDTHRDLEDFLSDLAEEDFEIPEVQERIRIDTYGHYDDHGPEIRRWLEGKA